ncbi:MAG TPA: monovalent cation:proton antiporter family protein [Ardenticatenaceae bacterium]|nr:monovalent cation:proton antiporter family protein [Ardenticatenaceae bacterium]
MEQARTFAPLLIVVLLAFIVPLVLSRLKRLALPIVVGEIVAGILIGRSGLGLVTGHDATLDLLAEFGFAFLMFQSGLEIDFSMLRRAGGSADGAGRRSWGPLPLGTLSFVLTLLLSTLIGFGLLKTGLVRNPWMMALILSTTSLGVVMPILKEMGLIRGRFGQSVLIAALIADFATMFLITVVVALLSEGLTLDILLVGLLFVAFFLVYRVGLFSLNRIDFVRHTLEELSHTTARIKIRAAFTMLLLFVVLSEVLGTEIILGAFLAGAMLSLLSTPEEAEARHQLEAIGFGFFIPIFFIMVGVRFNLAALLSSSRAMLLVPVLLGAAIVVKMVPLLLFRLAFGWRATIAAGILLSARLSLIIAASAIGLRLGLINEAVNSAIILVAVVTVTLAPLLFVRLAPKPEKRERPAIVVVGAGERGLLVAEQLRGQQEPLVVLDPDEARAARARQLGFEAIAANLDGQAAPARAHLEAADTLVSTYTDTALNYEVCRLARTRYGIDHVVSLVADPAALPRFEELGVTAVNLGMAGGTLLTLLTRNPAVYDLLTRTDDDKVVGEMVLHNPEYETRALRHLGLPGDLLVLAVRRDGEFIVPHGGTRLEIGDRLTLVGALDSLERARELLSPHGALWKERR